MLGILWKMSRFYFYLIFGNIAIKIAKEAFFRFCFNLYHASVFRKIGNSNYHRRLYRF